MYELENLQTSYFISSFLVCITFIFQGGGVVGAVVHGLVAVEFKHARTKPVMGVYKLEFVTHRNAEVRHHSVIIHLYSFMLN